MASSLVCYGVIAMYFNVMLSKVHFCKNPLPPQHNIIMILKYTRVFGAVLYMLLSFYI